MAYQRATWLADVLRAAGCVVVEHAGWRDRGLRGGAFKPWAVVWHHDASLPGPSPNVPYYLITNFTKASAQCWVDTFGEWHLIAAGRAPHAGEVLAGKPGNDDSIGVETDHTTGEPWPDAQLRSLRRGTAAILNRLGQPDASRALEFHRTICSPPGRKSDPAGLDLAMERVAVSALMRPPPPPPPPVQAPAPQPQQPPTEGDDDMPSLIIYAKGGAWIAPSSLDGPAVLIHDSGTLDNLKATGLYREAAISEAQFDALPTA